MVKTITDWATILLCVALLADRVAQAIIRRSNTRRRRKEGRG